MKVYVLMYVMYYVFCVFEGECVYGGVIYVLWCYLECLVNLVKIMGFELFVLVDELEKIKEEILVKLGFENVYVCVFVWCGSEMMGVLVQSNMIYFVVVVWVWGDYFVDKMKGICMIYVMYC